MKWWKDLRRSRDHGRSGRKLPNNCQALQTNKRKVENCSFRAQENYKWKSENRKENSEQADKSWKNSLRESAKGCSERLMRPEGHVGARSETVTVSGSFWDWKGPFPHPRIKNVKSPTWCEFQNTMGEILNNSREKRIPKFCARDRGRSLLASSKTPWNPAPYMQPKC